jgi:nucleotide-binding universal stress UspA family protein
MYEIVAAIDDSEARAAAVADAILSLPTSAEEMHVTLFHDFVDNPEGASVHQIGSVRRARDTLEDAGVTVELDESSGDPVETILAEVEAMDADLVAAATRARQPAREALFGSVTDQVVRGTDRPVLVCTADEE